MVTVLQILPARIFSLKPPAAYRTQVHIRPPARQEEKAFGFMLECRALCFKLERSMGQPSKKRQ